MCLYEHSKTKSSILIVSFLVMSIHVIGEHVGLETKFLGVYN